MGRSAPPTPLASRPIPATWRVSSWSTTTPMAASGAPTRLLLAALAMLMLMPLLASSSTSSLLPASRMLSVPSPTRSSRVSPLRPVPPTPSKCAPASTMVSSTLAATPRPPTATSNSKMTTNFCQTPYTLPNVAGNKLDFTIEFADKPGQTGVQYLFEVDINKRGAGSFPTSGGLTGANAAYSVAEMNHNINLGNLSELAECSDRGLDDGDGACECFDGFRGLACEERPDRQDRRAAEALCGGGEGNWQARR